MWLRDTALITLLQKPKNYTIPEICGLHLQMVSLSEHFQAWRDRQILKSAKKPSSEIKRKQLPSATGTLLQTCALLVDEGYQMHELRSRDAEKLKSTQELKQKS